MRAGTLDRAIDAVEAVINDAASANASAALREVRIYGGAAVFAMFLTLLLIWFVSRAVVGPVRRLTAAAREMSQRQLPALVESLRTGGDVERDQAHASSTCSRRTRSASSPRRSTTSRR